MAFLQLKKDHNKDQPIDVQFIDNPGSLEPHTKSHGDNTWKEYVVKCVNVGPNYQPQINNDYEIRAGQKFDFHLSESLYNKICDYQVGELVTIEMASNPKKPGQVFWKVRPAEKKGTKNVGNSKSVKDSEYGYSSVKERDIDRKLDILYGMAFNNATRIACTDNELTPAGKVKCIEVIMPKMFEIAQGLDRLIDDSPEDDDDVPF